MNLKYKKAAKAKLLQQERAWTEIHASLDKPMWVHPAETAIVPTGLKLEIPEDSHIVAMLTGHPSNWQCLTLADGYQFWDDKTEDFSIYIRNCGHDKVCIEHGQPIARLVMFPWYPVRWKEVV